MYKAILYNQHEMQPYKAISAAYVGEFETVPKEIHQNSSDAAFLALEQPALDSVRAQLKTRRNAATQFAYL